MVIDYETCVLFYQDGRTSREMETNLLSSPIKKQAVIPESFSLATTQDCGVAEWPLGVF